MEMIISWIKTIAATSIAGAVIYFLAPKGSSEKALRLVVAFSLIASILSPFISGVFKEENLWDFISIQEAGIMADDEAEKYASQYMTSLSEKNASILKRETAEILDSTGFKYSDIEISTDITQSSGIVISKIKIILKDKINSENVSEMKEKIKELTGTEPEFYFADGE